MNEAGAIATAHDAQPIMARLARPLLHAAHLVTFAVLLVTGLLLLLPDLRAAATGGYSLFIRQSHCWVGVAFVVLPIVIVLAAGVRNLAPAETRTLRARMQAVHFGVTVLVGVAFTVTGFLIWGKPLLPRTIVEPSRLLHIWLTYAAMVLVAVHLVEVAIAALIARITAPDTALPRQAPP